MKLGISTVLAGAVLCATILPMNATAAEQRPINKRQHAEQLRIKQGIRSGELTRNEAIRLKAEQAKVRVAERLARRDGKLSPAERIRLQRELNQASHHIFRQKHDRQDRN